MSEKPDIHDKPALIFSDKYFASFGEHVFPTDKYRKIFNKLRASSKLLSFQVIEPPPAETEDLELVHHPDYVRDFMDLVSTPRIISSELPLDKEIRDFFLLAAGGSIMAADESLKRGRAININGGFHHAFPDHAEGFCYLNDPAIAIRAMLRDKKVKKAAVIDCDLHQGNGTAYIFKRDKKVFTYSIHQDNIYPVKQASDYDVGLADDAGDEEYLAHLEREIPVIYDRHQPELVCYVAGADPYIDDQLGTLRLTKKGLRARDDIVIKEATSRGIAIFVVLAGGYAFDTEDVVDIHTRTAEALLPD